MRKKEAAEFLGIGIRTLESYTAQGLISVTYERGKTRPTANYNQDELERFKLELKNPKIKPAFESREIPQENHADDSKLALQDSAEFAGFSEIILSEKLAGIIEYLLNAKQPTVAIADKLVLTIAEIQQLTRLPQYFIKAAIANEELNAQKIGRSWLVLRTDLDDYLDHLFKSRRISQESRTAPQQSPQLNGAGRN